jgi:hypothetical protein
MFPIFLLHLNTWVFLIIDLLLQSAFSILNINKGNIDLNRCTNHNVETQELENKTISFLKRAHNSSITKSKDVEMEKTSEK